MRRFSKEEEAYFTKRIAEAEESIKKYGTFSEEEFWRRWEGLKEEARRYEKSERRNIKSDVTRRFGKISKKFIGA